MTLWESSYFSRWSRVTVSHSRSPSDRRATTALRSAVYQAAYWCPLWVRMPFFVNELLLTRPSNETK